MSAENANGPVIQNSFPSETVGALRAMNRASAKVVIENHKLGLPVIQYREGRMVETPAEELLSQALRCLEANGEPSPQQLGE